MRHGFFQTTLMAGLSGMFFMMPTGCKPDATAPQAASPQNAAPATSIPTPDFTISAADLSKEFVANSGAALTKYKGKILQITGVVADPAGGSVQASRVALQGTPDPRDPDNSSTFGDNPVNCYLGNSQIKAGANFSRGQEVTLQGTCSDRDVMNNITILDASIIKAAADPAIIISSADLAKAFVDDAEAAKKKYEAKPVALEGKLLEVNKQDYTVVMEGSGTGEKTLKVELMVGDEGMKVAQGYKVGQVIKARGIVLVNSIQSGKKIGLGWARLVG